MAKRGSLLRGPLIVISDEALPYVVKNSAGTILFSITDAGVTTSAGGVGDSGAIAGDVLVATNKKIEFRSTGISISSPSAGKLALIADAGGADDITLTGGVTIAGALAVSLGIQAAAVARTATVTGATTGTVAPGTSYVTVTAGADANAIIILPAPVVGNVIWLYVGATGYELRSSAPASIGINGGTGANAESAIPASTLIRMVCVSATAWIGTQFASNGTVSAVEVAAP